MNDGILVLGGYGTFGSIISETLTKQGHRVLIAGRRLNKAQNLAKKILEKDPSSKIETIRIDATDLTPEDLKKHKAAILINASGPYQDLDYSIAECCIKSKVHYIDLADARSFVKGISSLNSIATQAGVSIISGASTVPALSSAVIDSVQSSFANINELHHGITPGQKSPRGLATSKSILSYLGKPIYSQQKDIRYGWQDIHHVTYPILGKRLMGNCDVPDLELFPKYYSIPKVVFSAGMESKLLHLGIWLASWLVRARLPIDLKNHASTLLTLSHIFDPFGSNNGGMHMHFKGTDHNNRPKSTQWYLIAENGDGPHIPATASIVLANKLLKNSKFAIGAQPCVGLISLEEYLNALKGLDISTYTT